MGARVIRKPDPSARKKKESLTLWAIIAAVGFPLFLAYILVAVDIQSDLSELKPAKQADEKGFVPVGWPKLEGWGAQGRVRMIGYMMDGYKPSADGASVRMFVLLPEAGQFLHSRIGFQTRWWRSGRASLITFRDRQLVWARDR